MITAYLLRAILIGGLIGLAASLTELANSGRGRPRRFVWLAALLLATIVPAAGMFGFDRTGTQPADRAAHVANRAGGHAASGRDAKGGEGQRREASPIASEIASSVAARKTVIVPAWLQDFDRPLAVLWAASSLLWIAILVASAIRINRNRVHWREATLDGLPVYMSHDVGPALFGLTRFGIVVPNWVEALEPECRRLVMAHEREHARAISVAPHRRRRPADRQQSGAR